MFKTNTYVSGVHTSHFEVSCNIHNSRCFTFLTLENYAIYMETILYIGFSVSPLESRGMLYTCLNFESKKMGSLSILRTSLTSEIILVT